MGEVLRLPRSRHADLAIAFCDPGLDAEHDAKVAGKPPPMHLDAEAHVLTELFQTAAAEERRARHAEDATMVAAIQKGLDARDRALEMLRPEHFFSVANGRIYQAIQHLKREQTPITEAAVLHWLDSHGWAAQVGGAVYVRRIAVETASVGYPDDHARIVVECYERRRFIETCQRRSAEARGDCGDWGAYKAEARADFGRLTAPAMTLAGCPIGAAVEEAREMVRALASGAVMGVRYPWAVVEQLVGLLARGQQTILAGLSEHGKTAVMMEIVRHVASAPLERGFGEAVYVVTGEMPRKTLILRTACSFARVDAAQFLAGYGSADDLEAVGRELSALERLPIVIDDKPAPALEIAQRVKAHRATFGAGRARRQPRHGETAGELHPPCRLQLVVGDHAQALSAQEEGREEKDRIGNCAEGWVNHIAKGCDVATLLLSQLRAPEPKGPRPKFPPWPVVEHLFGSPNRIKATADTVIAVQRPELLMTGEIPAKWLGVMGLCRLKGRFGDSGRRVLLGFDRGAITESLPAAARCEPHYEGDEG